MYANTVRQGAGVQVPLLCSNLPFFFNAIHSGISLGKEVDRW